MAGAAAAVGAIFGSIGSAVVAVASTVASAVASLVGAIGAAVATVASHAAAAVAGVLSGLSVISVPTATSLLSSIGALNLSTAATFAAVAGHVLTIAGAVQSFLSAIQFKALLSVHRVAYILSREYRQKVNEMYKEISKVSSDLGLGAHTMTLLIENTRSMAAAASSLMGRNYDLFQVSWLKSFHAATKKMSVRMGHYAQNPGALIQDLDEWITKPSMDSASRAQLFVYQTLEKVTEATERIVNDVVELKEAVEKTIHDLPERLRKDLEPRIRTVTEKLDGFVSGTYRPAIRTLNRVTSVLADDQVLQERKIEDIAGRIKYPGNYLMEIEAFDATTRADQEAKIADAATRTYARNAAAFARQTEGARARLEAIASLADRPKTPLIPGVIERPEPVSPAGEQSRGPDTWYVGDY